MAFLSTEQSSYVGTSQNIIGLPPNEAFTDEIAPVDMYQTGSYWLVSSQMMVGVHPTDEVVDVAFDPLEELVWCISRMGQMTAFYSVNMERYISNTVVLRSTQPTSPHAPMPGVGELKRIFPTSRLVEHSVYVLSSNALYAYNKFGWHIACASNDMMTDLECFVVTGSTGATPNGTWGSTDGTVGFTHVFVGGLQPVLFELDAQERWGEVVRSVDTSTSGSVVLRTFASGLCAGTTDGKVLVVDPRMARGIARELDAHTGEISDMAVVPYSYTLVTSGWSQLSGATGLRMDRLLKVYDLRTGRAQVPVSASLDPSFTRFFPGCSDRLLAASQAGGFQTIQWDSQTISPADLGQLWPTYDRLVALDISQNGNSIVFSTQTGHLQLYSHDMSQCEFNRDPQPTEFASPLADSLLPTNCMPDTDPNEKVNLLADDPSNPLFGTNLFPMAKSAAQMMELQLITPSLHQPNITLTSPSPSREDGVSQEMIASCKNEAAMEAVKNAFKPIDYDDENFSVTNLPFIANPPPPDVPWDTDSPNNSGSKNRSLSSADWPSDMCKNPARTMLPVDADLLNAVNAKGTARKPTHWSTVWHPYSINLDDSMDPLNCDMTLGRFIP